MSPPRKIFFGWLVSLLFVIQSGESNPNITCPEIKTSCKQAEDSDKAVVCCSISSTPGLNQCLKCANKHDATKLYLKNLTLETLTLGDVDFGKIQNLILRNSRINKIKGYFRGQLRHINFTSVLIQDIDSRALKDLRNLETLDLSNNNITNVPDLPPVEDSSTNFTIDISGNSYLRCNSVIDLIDSSQRLARSLQFLNDNTTLCLSARSFNWFQSTNTVPLDHIIKSKRLETQCPKGCICSPYRVYIMPGHYDTYTAKVDCSEQHLLELPSDLPPNTRLLNVTNNNITSLEKLSVNDKYREIREFYADNNQIESITVLEGSYFIDHFSMLSLRGNNLKSIPTYILSNAFDRNRRVQNIRLGGNKLNCDCNAAQGLKMWLMTNKAYIPDYEDVLCEGDLEKVIFLDQNKVCRYKKEWTDYIYYIITGEIVLLVSIISKLIYDYYIFKSKGYLPWPASKMPKLPCEWVFDSNDFK